MSKGLTILLAFAVIYYAFFALSREGYFEEDVAARLAPGNQVVVYSLTTCPYCRTLRARLTRAGIPFSEYFIDADQARMQEFTGLLVARNIFPGAVGAPTLVVNGELLINNPGMDEIKRHLNYKD